MRFRVRLGSQTHKVEVVPGPSCSFGQLKRAIAQQLFPDDPAAAEASLQLSFNNKTPIQGEADADVKSLGITNGDLLWVLSPKPTQPPAAPAPEPKRAKETAGQQTISSAAPAAAAAAAGPSDVGAMQTDDVPGACDHTEEEHAAADEPPAAHAVPSYLLRTLAASSAAATAPAHVLLLAAHASMMEAGFEPTRVPVAPAEAAPPAAAAAATSSAESQGGGDGEKSSTSASPYALPPSCRTSSSMFRLAYRLPALQQGQSGSGGEGGGGGSSAADGACCTLQCSTMGPGTAVLVASTPKGHVHHLSLLASSFLEDPPPTATPAVAAAGAASTDADMPDAGSSAAGAEAAASGAGGLPLWDGQHVWVLGGRQRMDAAGVRRLWRTLKDGLAFPMLLACYADAGLPPPAGLLALPEDLKLNCLRHLNALQLVALSMCCAELRHLASQDELWKPLFDEEFPAASSFYTSQAQRRGYKWAFGACWRDRRQREEAARRQRRFMPAIPNLGPRPPFYPPPGPLGIPGITGGDYDRLPQPFLGGGPGMYSGGGLGGLMFGGGRRQGRGGGGFHQMF